MTPTTGRASLATLHGLWQCLLTALLSKSSNVKPSAEILTLARAFLLDNHYVGPVDTPKVRKQFDRLHELYLKGLISALSDGVPSASVLAEYRIYREQASQQQQVLEAAKSMQTIPVTAPFKTPN